MLSLRTEYIVRMVLPDGRVVLSPPFRTASAARRWKDLCRNHLPDVKEATVEEREPQPPRRWRSLGDAMKNAPELFDSDPDFDPAA